VKISRNDLCPCGSGKKFKQCCIDKLEPIILADHQDSPNHSDANRLGVGRLGDAHLDAGRLVGGGLGGRLDDDPLKYLIGEGYRLLDADEEARAAIIWLDAWGQLAQVLETSAIDSAESLDNLADLADYAIRGLDNWVQDLEDLLGNLSMTDVGWAERRLQYMQDFCTRLPNSHADLLFNMRRDAAEALFLLGRPDDGDKAFEALIRSHPSNEWAYIGWGDMYSPVFFKDHWPANPEKARLIYEGGLAAMGTEAGEQREELTRRIALMEEGPSGRDTSR